MDEPKYELHVEPTEGCVQGETKPVLIQDATPTAEWHGSVCVAVGGVLTPEGRKMLQAQIERLKDQVISLEAERDVARSDRAELVAALTRLLDRYDHERAAAGSPAYTGGPIFAAKVARELLARLK